MERNEAISVGQSRYFTGRPCKYGHLSERNTVTGACLECVKINQNANQQRARDAIKNAKENTYGAR